MSTYTLVHIKGREKLLKFDRPLYIYQYYKNFRLDLISGNRVPYSLAELEGRLETIAIGQSFSSPRVFHCYYELGYNFCAQIDKISEVDILLTEIEYQDVCWVDYPNKFNKHFDISEVSGISFEKYRDKFNVCYDNLVKGNCYQINLTHVFNFSFAPDISADDFCKKLFSQADKLGGYAHATYIEEIQKLILSNSPECLFKIKELDDSCRIVTMPIKGTIPFDSNREREKDVWQKLSDSKKDEGELNMITDLLRNDLSSIDSPNAQVIQKKALMVVPGIIHQYSLISVMVKKSTTLLQQLRSIFPGGSVTGAPKKRVVEIISQVEDDRRGIYCGSTIIFHKSFRAGSINIRTAEIDFNSTQLRYGAGGGVTLLSRDRLEYEEMLMKLKSFISLFL